MSELSKSIKSIYSTLEYLQSDGDDFNFLVSYIKSDYKIFSLKNLKYNFLSDNIISCYLDELIVISQKVNNILIFKLIILVINVFFVTYQFTGDFLEYLCNENFVNPSFIFLTGETPSLAAIYYLFKDQCLSNSVLFLIFLGFLDKRQIKLLYKHFCKFFID